MAIRILSSENITGNLTLSGNQTTGGNAYVTGTSNSLVVISRDNMFVDAGQFYLGADDGTTDDSFRQRTASGSYFIESRKSGTWTNRLQINTAGTLIVQQGMAISGNIDGVGATFIGTAASGAALVTIENNSGSTATSYGLLVLGGGNSSNGRTFEVRDASGNTDLIVKGDGNVGIGTATPGTALAFGGFGSIWVNNDTTNPFGMDTVGGELRLFVGASSNTYQMKFGKYNGTTFTPHMTIGDDGSNPSYVGIGTTTPDYKLDVRNGELTVRPSSSGNVGLGKIGHSSNNAILQLYDSSGNEDVRISTSLNSYFNGGNVGIGTTSPSAKLDIGLGTLGNNGLGGLRIFDDATHFWMLIRKNSVGATRLSLYHGQGSVPLVFQEGGGNVGIGTTSPTEKLSVSGNIELDDMPANGTRYLMTNETNTGTGRLNIQAGGGSAAYGGGLSLIANSHASKPGWVIAGISSGAGTAGGATEGRFVVNTHGLGTGSDLFTVLRTGNVGIGTASPSYKLDVESDTDSVAGAYIQAGKSSQGEIQNTGLIIGSRTDTATGDYLGISFSGNSSVPARGRAAIGAISTSGASAMDLVFMTRNAGDGSQLGSSDEKMRITSGGYVAIPDTSGNHSGAASLIVTKKSSIPYQIWNYSGTSTSFRLEMDEYVTAGNVRQYFQQTNGGVSNGFSMTFNTGSVIFGDLEVASATQNSGSAFKKDSKARMTLCQGSNSTALTDLQEYFNPNGAVGKIQTSGSATLFTTSSDYRLKEDLKSFSGLEVISKIPVYDFKWKISNERGYGVMAHELQEVLPQAVGGDKDYEKDHVVKEAKYDDDHNLIKEAEYGKRPSYQTVDYSKIVPLLVKSIQELKAEIELLKNK